jgi:sulfate adenylyltransferase
VYVSTPVDVCMLRDRKGLYARARAGVITDLTGVGENYEVPTEPALVVDMASMDPDVAADAILEQLVGLGCLRRQLTN